MLQPETVAYNKLMSKVCATENTKFTHQQCCIETYSLFFFPILNVSFQLRTIETRNATNQINGNRLTSNN